jgi:hypothetical protein
VLQLTPQVNASSVQANVVELAACVMMDSPGMACPLSTSLLSPDFQARGCNSSSSLLGTKR